MDQVGELAVVFPRIDHNGVLLLLKEQNRWKWDQRSLETAFRWFEQAMVGDDLIIYNAEAWIVSEHSRTSSVDETNWEHIATGYDLLYRFSPSPIHQLNRAIAITHRDGLDADIQAFPCIKADSFGTNHSLWHAARAKFRSRPVIWKW